MDDIVLNLVLIHDDDDDLLYIGTEGGGDSVEDALTL